MFALVHKLTTIGAPAYRADQIAFALIYTAVVVCGPQGQAAAAKIDFQQQIAPIFQQHCLHCHNETQKSGELSLAFASGLIDSGHLIPGDPQNSYLMETIHAFDGETPSMPEEGTPLSEQQVDLIRRWIAEGAHWPDGFEIKHRAKADASWWSLQKVAEVSPPQAAAGQSQHPIDRFIQHRLEQEKIASSPEADRRTLIRRLYHDLIGLPPTPEAVAAFIVDPRPEAYENLVDRLLASKHFGERWARHWLDVAHYGDTHGFERDKLRDNAWHYRDYVIRAFNDDMPYDQFLREQIAGDVIAPDDPSSVVATGFLAAGPWDFVGQVEAKSPILKRAARTLDLDDMVTQVMTSTMAMTVNCARCHDHKLDPITQREYYQLVAVFAGLQRQDRIIDQKAQAAYDDNKKRLEADLAVAEMELQQLQGRGINLADVVGGGNGLGTGKKGRGIDPRSGKLEDRSYTSLDNLAPGQFNPCDLAMIDGVFIPANKKTQISSTELFATELPKHGSQAWDLIRNGPVASQFSTTFGSVDFAADGRSMIGMHANAGITFDLENVRRRLAELETDATVSQGVRFRTTVGYGGRTVDPSAEFHVFVDGESVASQRIGRNDAVAIDIPLGPEKRFLTLISTDGGNGYGHDQISFGDPRIIVLTPSEMTDDAKRRQSHLLATKTRLQAELKSLKPSASVFGVKSNAPAPVHVLLRGDPESPGEEVSPGGLHWSGPVRLFGDPKTSEGSRRLGLVNWIVDPENPLTARVIVNRLWHWHFGAGIVDTPSDFGYGGSQPSHPQLLDWLAAELIRQKWSLKAIHRLIVTSETYRQSSCLTPVAADPDMQDPRQIDVDNRLLWRMNARRLEAEAVRDSVLSITGKLNPAMYGPGYRDFDYQEAYAPIYTYKTADAPELWRRSVYRFIVRTTPSPFMTALDCPDPANLTAKRNVTTTALQSLAMYNNEFMLQQSSYLAQKITSETDVVDDQIRQAFKLVLVRSPQPQEFQAAQDLVAAHGLMPLCRALFNANEFIWLD